MVKKRRKLRVGRLFLPVLVLVMLGVVLMTAVDQQSRIDAMAKEEQTLSETLSSLHTEKSRLERMIDYAGTNAYIEQIARDVLGWVKPGETKYVLPEEANANADSTDELQ